eukprot:1787594-Rhodomonas_salina.4
MRPSATEGSGMIRLFAPAAQPPRENSSLPDSSNSLFIDDECARGAWGCWQLPVTDISDLSAMTLGKQDLLKDAASTSGDAVCRSARSDALD